MIDRLCKIMDIDQGRLGIQIENGGSKSWV